VTQEMLSFVVFLGINLGDFITLTGGSGVRRMVILPLSEAEKNGLVKSCNLVWDVQKGVWDSV
jgi:hypothetical protein